MQWVDVALQVEVKAKPSGLWTLVRDWLQGPLLLKFEVHAGLWSYTAGASCTADGDYPSPLAAASPILAGAPLGALIAKFGGSSAGIKDGDLVLIGATCAYAFSKPGAPFYLTINDDPKAMADNSGSIKVDIKSCTPSFLFSGTQPLGFPAVPVIAPAPNLGQQ